MAIWQYDVVAVPREPITSVCGRVPTNVSPELFDRQNWWTGVRKPDEAELSVLLPRSNSWSESIKAWGASDGNCIELHFDKGELFEMKIRIDVREPSKEFLAAIVAFTVRHDLVVWTEETSLFQPSLDAFASDIARSRAFSFVRNPSGFLEGLEEEKG